MKQGEDRRSRFGHRWRIDEARLEVSRRLWFSFRPDSPGVGGVLDDRPRPPTEPLGIWRESDILLEIRATNFESWDSDSTGNEQRTMSTMGKDATGQRTEDRGKDGGWRKDRG